MSSNFWQELDQPKQDFWEGVGETPSVSVSFQPSTATDEELRQYIAKNIQDKAAIQELHQRNLAESNPTLGQATEAAVNAATTGFGKAITGIPAALGAAGSFVNKLVTGDPSLAQDVYGAVKGIAGSRRDLENNPGLIGQMAQDVGAIGMAAAYPTQMPASQFAKAGEPIGENIGMFAAPPAIGFGIGTVAGAVRKVAPELSSKIMNSVMKTAQNEFRFGHNPGYEVAKQGLTAANEESLLAKVVPKKQEFIDKVDAALNTPKAAKKIVDGGKAIDIIDAEMAKAAKAGEQQLYDRLQALKEQMTRTFEADAEGNLVPKGYRWTHDTPAKINELKKEIGEGTRWTGQAFDTDVNRTKVKVYGALNDAIEAQVPGVKADNRVVSNLIGAQKSLEKVLLTSEKKSPFQLGGSKVLAAGTGALFGGPAGALIGAGAEEVLNSVAFKTQLAKYLAKITPAQRQGFISRYASIPAQFEGMKDYNVYKSQSNTLYLGADQLNQLDEAVKKLTKGEHGFSETSVGARLSPSEVKVMQKEAPELFADVPADKGVSIVRAGEHMKKTSRHEYVHAALEPTVQKFINKLFKKEFMQPTDFVKRYPNSEAPFQIASDSLLSYGAEKRPEEMLAYLVSGDADRLSLTREQGLQLLGDLTDYVSRRHGPDVMDKVFKRLAPKMKGSSVELTGGSLPGGIESSTRPFEQKAILRPIKEKVAGLQVRDHIPNQDSISASLLDYKILPGIREVQMSDFTGKPSITNKSIKLADEIKESGEINPLIVVQDAEGLYILEGANRWDALHALGKKSFPALVVQDLESLSSK